MENKPILDTILKTKQATELTRFNPVVLVASLSKTLTDREKDVLNKRHAMAGHQKHTLESIGQGLNVTRERVRQIELSAIRKIKALPEFEASLAPAEKVVSFVLDAHGGLMEQTHLLENMLEHTGEDHVHKSAAIFVLSHLLNDRFNYLGSHEHLHPCWRHPGVAEADVLDTINHLVAFVHEQNEPVAHDLLVREAGRGLDEKVVLARLRSSKKIKNNVYGQWGLSHWNTITPKRMNDKIYLVLKEHGKPLHFTDIAKMINQMAFDAKVAYPATVHNELILDKKYVLVGRGIYALADWGYKRGVVADVIEDIIKTAGRPLTRDAIVQDVLKQRIVGKSTIHLALMNKARFAKTSDGKFTLSNAAAVQTLGQKTETA